MNRKSDTTTSAAKSVSNRWLETLKNISMPWAFILLMARKSEPIAAMINKQNKGVVRLDVLIINKPESTYQFSRKIKMAKSTKGRILIFLFIICDKYK